MTSKELKKHIEQHRLQQMPRLRRLQQYYLGEHDVLHHPPKRADGKPDHRLVCNFCRSITDATVGYFMGKPVTYSCRGRWLERMVADISQYNDDQYVCSALARDLSVYGVACELLWLDEEAQIRFSVTDPLQVIPIYSQDLAHNLLYAIRVYRDPILDELPGRDSDWVCEVYDDRCVQVYREFNGEWVEKESYEHGFSQVPLNFYYNNADAQGDFEPVMSLVDAYNRLQSESLDDFELFADSYLAISGMGGTTAEDIAKLRQERVLLLEDGGKAEWLTKQVNDSYVEHLKERISRDIFRFSSSVDLSEDAFWNGTLSGIAMRYRMLHFENRVAVTERFFKKGLQRRWELICEVLNLFGSSYDWRKIKITFSRNLPFHLSDTADTMKTLEGVISHRTALEQLPFVGQVDEELERIREEQQQQNHQQEDVG